MLKLLPDCDSEELSYAFSITSKLTYNIKILDSTRYTSTLQIAQIDTSTPDFMRPSMTVRLYHDARVAEVLESQRTSQLKPVYEYPNLHMHQRNEKFLVNVFLAEWLHFCLTQRVHSSSYN